MNFVVETNVTIAANGRNTHASLQCQINCIDFLEMLTSKKSKGKIVLDRLGLIMDEYKGHLNYRGQPGVGDAFYKYVHDHMYFDDKIHLVSITLTTAEDQGFKELPKNSVDKSDRKFLAAALVGRACIANALDTDWLEQSDFVKALGVDVEQLCPDQLCPLEI